jgi:hypothetical protein
VAASKPIAAIAAFGKLAFETPFDVFTTQLNCCFVQQDRINDFVTFDLSGDKRGVGQSVRHHRISPFCRLQMF